MSSSRKKTKLCPHLRKPCVEDECAHWKGYPLDKPNEMTRTVVTEIVYMCNDHWIGKMLFDIAGFTDYTGKATNQLRNQVSEGNATLGGLVYEAKKRLVTDSPLQD